MNPHMRRIDMLLVELDAHFLEQAEMNRKVIEGHNAYSILFQDPPDLSKVWVHLERGKMDKHVVREDTVKTLVGKITECESVQPMVADIAPVCALLVLPKHFPRDVTRIDMLKPTDRFRGDPSASAPDLESIALG